MKNFLLTLIAFLIFGNLSFGQNIEMIPLGAPSGAQITHFTVNESGTILAVQNTGKFFRSTDNGNNWTEINVPTKGAHIAPICHPDGSFYFIGEGDGNFAYQIPANSTEAKLIDIIPGIPGIVNSISATREGDLFVLFYGRIYKSTDAGATWSSILNLNADPANLGYLGNELITLPGSEFVYLKRYQENQNQEIEYSFSRFKKDGSDFENVFEYSRQITKIIRQSDSTLVVATHSGAFASNEHNLDFRTISDPKMQFSNLSLSKDGELIFIEKDGIFRMKTPGASLIPMDLGNNPGRRYPGTKLIWNETANHYFLIQKNSSPTNFFKTNEHFGNWHPLTPEKITLPTDEVAFKSTKNSIFIKPKTGTEGYYVSKNEGKNFYSFLVDGKLNIKQLAQGNDLLLFAIAEDDKVYSTPNEGKSWELVNVPREVIGSGATPVTLKTGPFGEVLISYYDNGEKLFYSKDSGDSWQKISDGTVGTKHLAFHPSGDIFGVFYPTAYVRETDTADLRRYRPLKNEWNNIRKIHGKTSNFSISEQGLISLKSTLSGVGAKTYISDDFGETMTESEMPDFYTSPNGLLFATNEEEIILSKNRGEDWERIYFHGENNPYRNLYLDFENYLYAVFENGPIYKSEEPIIEHNFITGNIFIDENRNCEFDSREARFPEAVIRAKGDTDFYAKSDESGRFVLPVLSDDYEISIQVNDEYWIPCESSIMTTIAGVNNSVEVNIPLQPAVECPGLEVNLVVPEIQKCEESIFRVKYCNKGTKKAVNAYVVVQLDTRFSILESDIEAFEHNDDFVTFYLGDVEIFDCEEFSFTTAPVCDLDLGETICTEARIYPDVICVEEAPNWSGASLRVTGECVGNKLEITVKNVGHGDMLDGRPMVIIEDLLLLRDPEVLAIPAGHSVEIVVTPSGETIRVLLDQVEGHPGFSNPSITLENCELAGTNPAPSEDNYAVNPFIETACLRITPQGGFQLPSVGEFNESPHNLVEETLVNISPNPLSETAIIKVLSNETEGEFICEIQNTNGRIVRSQTTVNQQVTINRTGLVSGIYFYKIYNKTRQIASGKIIVN